MKRRLSSPLVTRLLYFGYDSHVYLQLVREPADPHECSGCGLGAFRKNIGENPAHYATELGVYAKSLSDTYGQDEVQFLYAQPANSLIEGLTAPKIEGSKSVSFDQWPKSLKSIATALAELAE